MSVVIPKKGFKNSTPISVDEVNENLEVFIQEIQGNLGENNWIKDAFSITDMSNDAILRSYSVHREADWFNIVFGTAIGSIYEESATGAASTYSSAHPANHAQHHKVSVAFTWETISDMEITATTGNSVLWITFTGQIEFHSSQNSAVTYGVGNNLSGLQVGIFIDGSLISETVTGSMDRSNDPKGEGHHFKRDPVSVDCVIPVSPGSHVISARARMARHHDYDRQYNSIHDFYAVGSRQLYVVEMR